MGRRGWLVTGAVGAVVLGLIWILSSFGAFTTSEELERRGEALDGGVFGESPFGAADADGSVPEGHIRETPKGERSLALAGRASVVLHDFSMNDKEGRTVLRVKKMTGIMDISAMRRGIYRVSNAKAQGIEVTLYRDQTGKVSIVHALSQSPPTVRRGLHLPPKGEHKEGAWLLEVGPVDIEDATLTLGFTEKPVQFHVESARIMVRRRPEDEGPMIYIEDVEGEMLKPKPLPKPVRIAFADGLVRLVGEPLVDLTARTCIGRDELRVHAIVPARKEPVQLTVDSAGIAGALGRMGLKIASRRDSDKLSYKHGAVKIVGGPSCKHKK